MHKLMSLIILAASLLTSYTHAGMVSTQEVILQADTSYSATQLQSALDSAELKQQLQELGVDPTQLSDRIASLTPAEIQQLNAELAEQPAGGIIGVLVLIFVLFVITDMLCATDIFGFVKCINE
ncbi:MAG: PA2779 family protein [Pseudomonadota bacterium]